jgi:type II secretion system protein G
MKYLFGIITVCSIGLIVSCSGQPSVSQIPTDYRLRSGESELTFQQQMYYIAAALEIYRLHTASYPTQEENLEALITKPETLGEESGWFGPYAESELFFIDPWNNRIAYSIQPNEPYDLRSYGKDGIQSEDDIIARELMPDLFREMDKLAGYKPLPPNVVPTKVENN